VALDLDQKKDVQVEENQDVRPKEGRQGRENARQDESQGKRERLRGRLQEKLEEKCQRL
jgi:hypothetical protein